MEKVNFFVSAHILFTITAFISSSVCVRWYPNTYPVWRPHHARQSEPLHCPAPRGQFSHPKYCDQFLNCWDGAPTVGQCQGGLVFNEAIAACDYPRNVDCMGKGNSQTTPEKDPACPKAFGTFANPRNCSEYVVCHSGMAFVKECPENTYYNSELRVCNHERDSTCTNEVDVGEGPAGPDPSIPPPPAPAGTPTVSPTEAPSAPFEPKPPLNPGEVPSTEAPAQKPQHPLRPKPPLDVESENKPDETKPDPTTPQLQEPELSTTTSTKKPSINLQPKPPLQPEDATSTQRPPIEIPESLTTESPPPSVPPLNHSSLRPPQGAGPPSIGPSTTPAPIDGEDDPHILFPFLPPFPEIFRCPVANAILPIVGDCESVIICVHGIAHNFRCYSGHMFDLQKGRCVSGGKSICSAKQGIGVGHKNSQVVYAYLPLSVLREQLT